MTRTDWRYFGIVLFLCAVSACAGKGEPPAASPAGAAASWARAVYAFDSLDERPISSEHFRGKRVVLAFVTTDHLGSQAQLNYLNAMAKHDGDRVHYAMIALDARERRELVELYRKALGIPFPVAMVDAAKMGKDGPFGELKVVPTVIVLDADGRETFRHEGVIAANELRSHMGR